MDPFENAVAELVAAASVDDAYAAAQRLLAELDAADDAARQRALGRLADVLPSAPVECAGLVALACGALVEHGGDPLRPLDALLGRLPDVLAGAVAFADACRARDKDAPAADAVERFGEEIANAMPAEAVAWGALDLFARAALAVLARSADARRRARARPELLKRSLQVADSHEGARFLAEMLRVLDDEELLVLHPESGRGWKVRVGGISDNFQLHTLLADALIGDPEKGLLPGRRPDPRVAAAARDRPVDPSAALAEATFELTDWAGRAVRNEGVPDDIEKFEGTRVLLLGSPAGHRTWDAGRRFEDMPAYLEVTETPTSAAAAGLLDRIAAAARP